MTDTATTILRDADMARDEAYREAILAGTTEKAAKAEAFRAAVTVIAQYIPAELEWLGCNAVAPRIPRGGDGLVERPSEAIAVLGGPYRQLDMDGVIVGVSRQAICETLTYLAQLEAIAVKLAGALERIANEGGELYNAWIDDGCEPKDAIRAIDDLARIACQALEKDAS